MVMKDPIDHHDDDNHDERIVCFETYSSSHSHEYHHVIINFE
jgi:hypothetical protein